MFGKILLGLDGSPESYKALKKAIEIAKHLGLGLDTISVDEVPNFPSPAGKMMRDGAIESSKFGAVVHNARELAKKEGVEIHCHGIMGNEVKAIIEFIKKYRFDLLVIGVPGQPSLGDWDGGITGLGLIRLAPCSVLVAK